jgi:hypothetical protein
VAELIDRLPDETAESIGPSADLWATDFTLVEEGPRPDRDGPVANNPPPSAFRELVRRGVAALPGLLDHVDDARLTTISIEHRSESGGMWHSDEYAPRYADPKRQPAGVHISPEMGPIGGATTGFTFHVGDFCFMAVGQIVNRQLLVARGQPTACTVINSPVRTPALARAVRADWSGLTADQHRESLTRDACGKRPDAAPDGLRRLLFYYPEEGERVALRLLARPRYNERAIRDFVMDRLVREPDPAGWEGLVRGFTREQGAAAAAAVPYTLRCIYLEGHPAETPEFLIHRERAGRIMAALYPGYDPNDPPFIDGARPFEQTAVVWALERARSEKIDEAVYRVFAAAAATEPGMLGERYDLDDLALACVARLAGKGHDAEFRAFVSARARAAEAWRGDSRDRGRLDELREWQKRLGD